MAVIPFFKLIRIQNLLMILGTQFLVKYFLFEPFGIATFLSDFGFFLLVVSMVALAAAGNIINDIFDVETDSINKPGKLVIGSSFSEGSAYNWFLGLNILGVGIGFYLSNLAGHPGMTALFILPSAFLYLYATHLKKTILVGNMVVSIMVAMIIVMVGIFDLFPAITPENRMSQKVVFSVLLDYAFFAFLVNMIREMVKDQEDIDGDFNAGMQTLPIILGRERTNRVIFTIGLLSFFGVLYYIFTYLKGNPTAVLYTAVLILAPLAYFLVRILGAKNRRHFGHLSRVLKFILAAGLFSIGLYRFILI